MFLFTLMIICAVIIKICFHHAKILSKFIPESCVLILLGILLAVFNHYILEIDSLEDNPYPKFTADLFFNVLLPPIILDSAFALYDRDFLSNLSSIITFAVVGTLFNVFTVGFTLYGLSSSGILGEFEKELTVVQSLIFSSLISAVDPVAVLAIFEEIQVNMSLYFLVFGESLLNDGVTVVLYNTMIAIVDIEVGVKEVFMAILSFLFVVFGGFFIGVLNGAAASFLTTKTQHVRVVEPLLIFGLGYMGFIMAELVHWSGIISIIGFGLMIKRYAFTNISQKSYTTVKYTTKTLAALSDCIIFLFLGIVLITEKHNFRPGFIIATIIVCTIYRFIGTFFFSWLVNKRRSHEIKFEEQFIMAYGGLRGAVGFSLACVLTKDQWYRELFLSTALAMVFFTVFLQGSTIKLFVKLFKIKLQSHDSGPKKITPHIQTKLIDDIMAGVESVVGKHGSYTFHEVFNQIDNKYVRRFLISKDKREGLEREYEKVMLDNHFTHLYGANVLAEHEKETLEKPEFSTDQHLKSFTKGINASSWGMYKNKFNREMTADEATLRKHLFERNSRAKEIESRIFLKEAREGIPNLELKIPDNNGKRLSTSSLSKASKLSSQIKDKYDVIQIYKRNLIERSQRSTPNPTSDI
eukprot:GFUD01004844.1.p1 GENE.GFUD01004844.1~~GFUD01004844.1.p1  ORF type:complete len:660 (+),score=147.40 GFUD01004844.1:71-1981(+)